MVYFLIEYKDMNFIPNKKNIFILIYNYNDNYL